MASHSNFAFISNSASKQAHCMHEDDVNRQEKSSEIKGFAPLISYTSKNLQKSRCPIQPYGTSTIQHKLRSAGSDMPTTKQATVFSHAHHGHAIRQSAASVTSCGAHHNLRYHLPPTPTATSAFPPIGYRFAGPSVRYCWKKGFSDDVPIGSGYTSTVYRGLDTITGDALAIKLVSKTKQRSLSSAQYYRVLYRRLTYESHPCVLRIRDFLEDKDHFYIVTDLCRGPDLVDYVIMHTNEGIGTERVRSMIWQLLQGLQYLHRRGLIHRDIKLDNIVFMDNTCTQLVIVDFDMVIIRNYPNEAQRPDHTRNQLIAGTQGYMAPESYVGVYSEASDLWGVGVILHILLDGRFPFMVTEATDAKATKGLLENLNVAEEVIRKCPQGADLMIQLLTYNIDNRLKEASDAMRHPWFSQVRADAPWDNPDKQLTSSPSNSKKVIAPRKHDDKICKNEVSNIPVLEKWEGPPRCRPDHHPENLESSPPKSPMSNLSPDLKSKAQGNKFPEFETHSNQRDKTRSHIKQRVLNQCFPPERELSPSRSSPRAQQVKSFESRRRGLRPVADCSTSNILGSSERKIDQSRPTTQQKSGMSQFISSGYSSTPSSAQAYTYGHSPMKMDDFTNRTIQDMSLSSLKSLNSRGKSEANDSQEWSTLQLGNIETGGKHSPPCISSTLPKNVTHTFLQKKAGTDDSPDFKPVMSAYSKTTEKSPRITANKHSDSGSRYLDSTPPQQFGFRRGPKQESVSGTLVDVSPPGSSDRDSVQAEGVKPYRGYPPLYAMNSHKPPNASPEEKSVKAPDVHRNITGSTPKAVTLLGVKMPEHSSAQEPSKTYHTMQVRAPAASSHLQHDTTSKILGSPSDSPLPGTHGISEDTIDKVYQDMCSNNLILLDRVLSEKSHVTGTDKTEYSRSVRPATGSRSPSTVSNAYESPHRAQSPSKLLQTKKLDPVDPTESTMPAGRSDATTVYQNLPRSTNRLIPASAKQGQGLLLYTNLETSPSPQMSTPKSIHRTPAVKAGSARLNVTSQKTQLPDFKNVTKSSEVKDVKKVDDAPSQVNSSTASLMLLNPRNRSQSADRVLPNSASGQNAYDKSDRQVTRPSSTAARHHSVEATKRLVHDYGNRRSPLTQNQLGEAFNSASQKLTKSLNLREVKTSSHNRPGVTGVASYLGQGEKQPQEQPSVSNPRKLQQSPTKKVGSHLGAVDVSPLKLSATESSQSSTMVSSKDAVSSESFSGKSLESNERTLDSAKFLQMYPALASNHPIYGALVTITGGAALVKRFKPENPAVLARLKAVCNPEIIKEAKSSS